MSSWAVPSLQWGPIWSWRGVAARAGLGGGQLFQAEPHPHSHRSGCFSASGSHVERPREEAGLQQEGLLDGPGGSVSTVCCSEFRGSRWGRGRGWSALPFGPGFFFLLGAQGQQEGAGGKGPLTGSCVPSMK